MPSEGMSFLNKRCDYLSYGINYELLKYVEPYA